MPHRGVFQQNERIPPTVIICGCKKAVTDTVIKTSCVVFKLLILARRGAIVVLVFLVFDNIC